MPAYSFIKNMIKRILRRIATTLEGFFSKSWLNPFATLWVNFRSLDFKDAIQLPIYVYGNPKIHSLSGSIKFLIPVHRKMVIFNYVQMFAPSGQSLNSEILNTGTIVFGGGCIIIGRGTKICVNSKAELRIGKNTKIADNINIGCYHFISMGDNTRIAHRCQIFDTNYHFIVNVATRTVRNCTGNVSIGSNCWVCNDTTVNMGAVIPDKTIVTSRSLCNKDYSNAPAFSIIGGVPAKLIKTGSTRVFNVKTEAELIAFFSTAPENSYTLDSETDIETLIL